MAAVCVGHWGRQLMSSCWRLPGRTHLVNRPVVARPCELVSAARLLLCRSLSVQEYISVHLMRENGITVPRGEVASYAMAARDIANELGGDVVIKAQVLAGGRGKGHFLSGLQGGVKVAGTPDEAMDLASQMIGQRLVTKQTPPTGVICNKVLVTEKLVVKDEYYFAIAMDRAFMGPVMVGSSQGGVNIEEVARTSPDAIIKDAVDIMDGLSMEQAVKMAEKIGFPTSLSQAAAEQMVKLYQLFIDHDATMVEVNPLVITGDDKVVCMDAKINFDDNSEYRQKDIFKLKDWNQEDPRDVAAAKAGINYIGLDGSIGCMVNGAGLAMATMDVIKLHGGSPANFLDIGGGASAKEVMDGFHILDSDRNVRAIFVNVFGGIIRCDMIAKGIIAAATELNLRTPLVVRLQGNNQKKARAMIEASGLKMIAVEDFNIAAKTVVNVARISELAGEVSISVDFSTELS